MKQIAFLFLAALLISIPFSCTESTLIGSELLEEDLANLKFRNDIPVDATSARGIAVPTYNRFQALQLDHYLLGQIENAAFGKSTASAYSQISKSEGQPDFNGVVFDSIILSIALDTLGNYGDLSQPIHLEVFQVLDAMNPEADYSSDQSFAIDETPIGSASVVPSFDSISIANYQDDNDIVSDEVIRTFEVPHLRIPLTTAFGESLIADSTIYQSDDNFQNFLKGIYIRPSKPGSGITSLVFDNSISRITLYYKIEPRNTVREYRFPFLVGQARVNHFEHDYEGSAAVSSIGTNNPELLYLQSMAGLNVDLSFPDLTGLDNIVINKAELELTVASEDDALFPPAEQLIITSLENGTRNAVADVRNAIQASNPISTGIFGGIPVIETVGGASVTKYRINISSHFQNIISNRSLNTITISSGTEEIGFYLPIKAKAECANEVVFYGSNHPSFAPKLNLTFTSL